MSELSRPHDDLEDAELLESLVLHALLESYPRSVGVPELVSVLIEARGESPERGHPTSVAAMDAGVEAAAQALEELNLAVLHRSPRSWTASPTARRAGDLLLRL